MSTVEAMDYEPYVGTGVANEEKPAVWQATFTFQHQHMGYNSYPRPTTLTRHKFADEPSTLKQAMDVIGEVASVKTTVTTALKHVKPANRNIIGGIGIAALLYWFYTAKSK